MCVKEPGGIVGMKPLAVVISIVSFVEIEVLIGITQKSGDS